MGRYLSLNCSSRGRGTNRFLSRLEVKVPEPRQTSVLNDHGTSSRSPKKRRQANSALSGVKEISSRSRRSLVRDSGLIISALPPQKNDCNYYDHDQRGDA